MKRYIIPILILCLLLAGCSIVVDDAGTLKEHSFASQEDAETAVVTGPTAPKNPYGPVDFGFDGEFITCLAGDYKVGIDVSEWQTEVNWQAIREAGVEYVMLRIGWRGSEEGKLFEDECFRSHYAGATAAGLQVGGYFFSQAVSVEEAQEEAAYVLQLLDGKQLQMPLIFDWEQINSTDRTADMDARTLTDCSIAFCEAVKEAGYDPGLYFNPDLGSRLLYLGELTDYRFWLAMYNANMTYPFRIDMWQYTNTGSVPGIDGDVDLNIYLIYEDGGTNNE